jgi:hypothetical protein
MRCLVIVKANKDSEAGVMPNQKILEAMGKFNEELAKAGVMLAAEGLHPRSKGKRVKFSGGKTTVTDGPFTETKELIAGLLAMASAIHGRSHRMAKTQPLRRRSRNRNPPRLRSRRLRRRIHPRTPPTRRPHPPANRKEAKSLLIKVAVRDMKLGEYETTRVPHPSRSALWND